VKGKIKLVDGRLFFPVFLFGTGSLLFLTALLIMIAKNAFFLREEMKHGYFDYS
jgi:hypothetical protein